MSDELKCKRCGDGGEIHKGFMEHTSPTVCIDSLRKQRSDLMEVLTPFALYSSVVNKMYKKPEETLRSPVAKYGNQTLTVSLFLRVKEIYNRDVILVE